MIYWSVALAFDLLVVVRRKSAKKCGVKISRKEASEQFKTLGKCLWAKSRKRSFSMTLSNFYPQIAYSRILHFCSFILYIRRVMWFEKKSNLRKFDSQPRNRVSRCGLALLCLLKDIKAAGFPTTAGSLGPSAQELGAGTGVLSLKAIP